MLKKLIDTMKLRRQPLLVLLLSFFCFFLVGFGILCAVMYTGAEKTWGTLGTIFGTLGVLIFIITGFLNYTQDFNLALSLGRTRKEFLILYALEQLIWVTAAYVLLILSSLLERGLYHIMFPHAWEEFSMLSILMNWWTAVVIPGIVLLQMFLGAMYSRFGKGFGTILYVIWLAGCLSMSRIAEFFESGNPVVAWLQNIPALGWAAIGITAAAAITATVIRLGMKQQVR